MDDLVDLETSRTPSRSTPAPLPPRNPCHGGRDRCPSRPRTLAIPAGTTDRRDRYSDGFELFLDGEHAEAMQRPMPRYHGGVAPSADFGGDRVTVGRDVARGTGIGQHRRIRRNVAASPWPQDQACGLDNGAIDLQEFRAGLERRDNGFLAPFSVSGSSGPNRRLSISSEESAIVSFQAIEMDCSLRSQ